MSNDAQPGVLRKLDSTGIPLLLARLAVGGMFVYLGAQKVQDPQAFLKAVKAFDILPLQPPTLINSVAVLLPWIEVVAGLAVLLGVSLRGAGATLFVSLLVFTPAVALRALGIYETSDIAFCAIKFDCGCGTGEVYICKKLLENTLLTLGSIVLFTSGSRRFCLGKAGNRYGEVA